MANEQAPPVKERLGGATIVSRRKLLAAFGIGGPAAAVAAAIAEHPSPAQAAGTTVTAPSAPFFPSLPATLTQENHLLRMQEDLKRAMAKPIEQRRWIMVIDQEKCVGCSACTIACVAENHLPPGVVYRPVIDEEIGEYPNVRRRFLPRPCMQCADPPCVPVCPVEATYKRPDGIVEINYDRCIGCRYCVPACPYGARTFDFGENYSDDTPEKVSYEMIPSPEYGKSWKREGDRSPIGNVRKCQFCVHRTEAGMLPACVTTCIGHATYFGDKNDENSLVAELIASPRVTRLLEELGTEPGVYYLM